MTEEKKTGRWAKSLDRAGLLDPVADSWEIPDADAETPDTIVVSTHAIGVPSSSEIPASSTRTAITSPSEGIRTTRTTDPPSSSETECEALRRQMYARFDVADYTGALETAEKVLAMEEDAEDASMMRLKCRNTLMQMFESRIGAFSRVPVRIVSEEDIVWRNLDALTAFIASNVDGIMSFEDIIDISTVSRFDTCRILSQLLQEGIIK